MWVRTVAGLSTSSLAIWSLDRPMANLAARSGCYAAGCRL